METHLFLMAAIMGLCFVACAMHGFNLKDQRPVTTTGVMILLIIITLLVIVLFYKSVTR